MIIILLNLCSCVPSCIEKKNKKKLILMLFLNSTMITPLSLRFSRKILNFFSFIIGAFPFSFYLFFSYHYKSQKFLSPLLDF